MVEDTKARLHSMVPDFQDKKFHWFCSDIYWSNIWKHVYDVVKMRMITDVAWVRCMWLVRLHFHLRVALVSEIHYEDWTTSCYHYYPPLSNTLRLRRHSWQTRANVPRCRIALDNNSSPWIITHDAKITEVIFTTILLRTTSLLFYLRLVCMYLFTLTLFRYLNGMMVWVIK